MEHSGHHFIAIVGGAVAGSEAAYQLALRGFRVVVFDQNMLPYGKIEDGLPKWHDKLRNKEEEKIDRKLSLPNGRFVPNVKLGKDIDFDDLARNWGFTAVLLAIGAWKDRSLPVDGIDNYVNRGLVYQNPFVYLFNHYHEPHYTGPQYEVNDNALVVGGGLASLDVVKILMIETVQRALKQRGHEVSMFALNHSIHKVLDDLGFTLDSLGLKGCTLCYRRGSADMPLFPFPTETAEQKEKARAVSQKILDNFLNKYLFRFEPFQVPMDKIVDGDRLGGLVFRKTKMENGKVIAIPNTETEVNSPLIISSIGSLPYPIPGIPSEGSVFKIVDPITCQIEGYDNVFALGNAVTGRGNIAESQKHGKEVSLEVMNAQLDWLEDDLKKLLRNKEALIDENVNRIVKKISVEKPMPDQVIQFILDNTKKLQEKAGYDGHYANWVKKHLPPRLEDMLVK